MKTYRLEIRKPFNIDIPTEKVKKGDCGIYVKHIKSAIKDLAILEITTPYGITYANPRKIKKEGRIIYRYYLKPKPMMLYLLTPKYDNKKDFEVKDEGFNLKGKEQLLRAWKEVQSKI